MYVPGSFNVTDKGKVLDFVKRFNFGTLISVNDSRPAGTHLPFVISGDNERMVLSSHLAKANSQWKDLDGQEALVIFAGPHAYISPKHYNNAESVPTWNYVAVHAYGKVEVVSETEKVFSILEQMIGTFESDYMKRWKGLPDDYKIGMVRGIVAFHIHISEIQASEKLSQNKSEDERSRIMNTLLQSTHDNERMIGEYMRLADTSTK